MSPVLALWLLPVPVADCLVLVARRAREHRSPFSAGRDHVHHIMQDAGFGPFGICAVLVGISLVTGLAAGQAMRLDVPNVVVLAAFLVFCAGWYALSARRDRAIDAFRALRKLMLTDVALGKVMLVPAASNDEVVDAAKLRAGGEL